MSSDRTKCPGVCKTVADSEVFLRALALLQSAYLYEESKQLFTYNFASVVKNPQLEEKYNTFCTKKRQAGYSEEDLKETYGFLLFDDVEKAKALGEKGLLTGNSDLTTLGDPTKGVYMSMYSDCLDPNRWFHPKSGHIAIFKLTKGKVKSVTENYTQTLTTPTEGFDCHVSEHLSSVSSQTSSFLAFERTQYYIYEHLPNGSRETAKSLSAACPLVIVSFSYMNSKSTLAASQEIREEEKPAGIYWPWCGELQIGGKSFTVGLKSKAGAWIPGKLPPVVKVCQAISVSDLQRSLPSTGFETCLTGEAFLDGLYCSLFELVSSQEDQKDLFALLLNSIQERNIALSVPLVDGGFLLLMHTSQLIQNNDASPEGNNVLQSLFVYPQSRIAVRAGTDFEQKSSLLSSEVLQLVSVFTYGESEVEKLTTNCSERLCDELLEHMQNYTQRTNSKSVSPPADEYDTHLCSCPQRNKERISQTLASYLSRPASFELPLSKVSEIMLAGLGEQREDLEEDVYVFPVSSECIGLEDHLDVPDVSVVDGSSPPNSEINKIKDWQAEDLIVQSKPCTIVAKINKALGIEDKDFHTFPSSATPPPAELIVSITTAAQGVAAETVSVQAPIVPVNSFNHKTGMNDLDSTGSICLKKIKEKRQTRGLPKKRNLVSSPLFRILSVDASKGTVEESNDKVTNIQQQMTNQQTSDACDQKCRTIEAATVTHGELNLQSTFLMELKLQPKEKTQHQLPVISKCGRILVPFGYVYTTKEIKNLRRKLFTNDKRKPDVMETSVKTEPDFTTKDGINVTKTIDARIHGDIMSDSGVASQGDILNTEASSVALKPESEKNGNLEKNRQTVAGQDKPIDALGSLTKRYISWDKLKSHFAKRKRKSDVVLTKKMTSNCVQDAPLISELETIATTSLSSTFPGADKGGNTKSNLRSDYISSSVQKPILLNETSAELQKKNKCDFPLRPNSRSPDQKKPNRQTGVQQIPKKVKTLKMPPGFPVERFKHEWWLHCGRSGFPESQKPQTKNGSGDNYLRNAGDKEQSLILFPTDALNLLAELALGANNETFPLPKNPALEQNSKTSVKIMEQQSVVCPLLGGNTTTPLLRFPSPRPHVGNRELIDLLYKEHDYSAPWPPTPQGISPALPQLVPLVGIAPKMQLDPLKPCGYENRCFPPFVSSEEQCDPNKTLEYMTEHIQSHQEFRNSRVFADEGGSLQITRQWPERYNFNLDSEIAIGQKEKTVCRVLHGPWTFPPQDDQSVRLIIHLWIGLFYTRTTPRLVEVGLDLIYPSAENKESSKPTWPTFHCGSLANSSDSPLDLSKKGPPASDQESVIRDLLQPKIVPPDPLVGKKETSFKKTKKTAARKQLISRKSQAEPQKGHRKVAQSKAKVKSKTRRTLDGFHSKHFVASIVVDSQEEIMNKVSGVGVAPKRKQKIQDCIQKVDGFSKKTDKQIVEKDITKPGKVKDDGIEKSGDVVSICDHDKEGSEGKINDHQMNNIRSSEQTCAGNEVDQSSDIRQRLGDKPPLGSSNLAEEGLKDMEGCSKKAENIKTISTSSLDEDLSNASEKVSPASSKIVQNKEENLEKSQSEVLNEPFSEGSCFFDGLFARKTFLHTKNSSSYVGFPVNGKQDWETEEENKLFGRTFIPFIGLDTPVEDALFPNSPLTKCLEVNRKETLKITDKKSDISPFKKQLLDGKETQPIVFRMNEFDNRSSTPTIDEKQFNSLASCSTKMIQQSVSRSLVHTSMESSLEQNLPNVLLDHCSSPSNVSDVETRLHGISPWMEELPYTNGSNLVKSTTLKEFLDSVSLPRGNHMSYFLNRRHVSASLGYNILDGSNSLMASNATSAPYYSSSHNLIQSCRNTLMLDVNWKSSASQQYPTTIHQQGSTGDGSNFPSIFIFPYGNSTLSNQTPVSSFSGDRIMKANFKASKKKLKQAVSKIKSESSGKELVHLIKQLSKRYLETDLTQQSLQQECIIFLEELKQLVKKCMNCNEHPEVYSNNTSLCSCAPLTSNVGSLTEHQSLKDTLEIEKSNRTCLTCKEVEEKDIHLPESSLGGDGIVEHAALGRVIAECAQQFEVALHKICGIAKYPAKVKDFRTHTGPSNHFDYCSPMKRKLDEDFESDMNFLVKRSCGEKYRFYILVTAEDHFFKEVKAQLEAEGHTAVAPSEFFTVNRSSSLLIILRNEDIAHHICEVPNLLQLKKSPDVLFAGIDTPDDVVNLTHREIFIRGGFIVIDEAALEHFSLCSMNKIWEILEMLNRKGKWKWMLHHRDSRRLKEMASTSAEAKEKNQFLSRGKEASLMKVLPYHECDLMSRDHPDYLTCLVRLHVQKLSYRYAVFVTDQNNERFERNGILTVNMNSFLTNWRSEAFILKPQAPSDKSAESLLL